jgi:protein involved in plasmid replication-relaxation
MCERRYRVGEQWYNLRPDALAAYRVSSQQFRFWLEWDRGTMNARDLLVKCNSYAHYIASREWARERSMPPALICIAPDIAQERRIMRIAQMGGLTHIPELVLWTSTELLLNEYGPSAPIWLKHIPQGSQEGQPDGLHRQKIFALVPEHMST